MAYLQTLGIKHICTAQFLPSQRWEKGLTVRSQWKIVPKKFVKFLLNDLNCYMLSVFKRKSIVIKRNNIGGYNGRIRTQRLKV